MARGRIRRALGTLLGTDAPNVFTMPGYIVRVVDGDTAVVHPSTYRPEVNVYIRFKDVWADEAGSTKGDAQTAAAQAEFPPKSKVVLTNDRIHWTYERLEARIDHAQ